MKLLRYVILILLLWGASSFSLVAFGETVGSNVSYLTYILLLGYYFLSKKRKLLVSLIILGLLYFVISGLIYVESTKDYINEIIKYFILIICGAELARDTSTKEFIFFLMTGAISILLHAVLFADGYGRYSGFYLNPNGAAFICLIGYCLTFNIERKLLKYILIFIFTFAGAITFSRFFFLMWLLVTLISVIGDKRNVQVLGIGAGAIVLLISVAAILQLNAERFAMLEGLLTDDVKTTTLTRDARLGNWSKYADDIATNPIFGNGYKSFSGSESGKQGVHNTYLMVIGESGFIPFFIIVIFYIILIRKAFKTYKKDIHKLLLAISLAAILMSMHNYFNNEVILFATIWLFVKLEAANSEDNEDEKDETLITQAV